MKISFSYSFFSLLAWALISSAFGFTLVTPNGVKLPDNDVNVAVASNTCSAAGFNSASELATMVEQSVAEYWNRVSTCALELEVTGVDSAVDTSSDSLIQALSKATPGTILVGCSDDATLFASSSTLGVASINTATGDRGVLLLNNRDTTFANLDSQEKLAVIAHELGHAFGLGHSSDASALMYFSVGGKVQKKLSIDDYDACSYLYPKDAPGGCGSVSFVNDLNNNGGSGPGPLSLITTMCVALGLALGLGRLRNWKITF